MKRGPSGKRPVQWTEKMKAEAAELWNGGMSAARIALHFRVTRNAVIGIITRNRQQFPRGNKVYAPKPARLPRVAKITAPAARPAVKDMAGQKPKLAKPSALGAAIGLVPRSTAAPKTDFPKPEALPEAPPVRFIDLGTRQCHWPLTGFGERAGADMPCCGQAVTPGKPYCAHHLSLAYRRRADD